MRWVVRAEAIGHDGTAETIEIGSSERACPTAVRDVGLTLSETKPLLARLQPLVVLEQLRRHGEQAQICGACGTRRAVKDYRDRRIATLLGTVHVKAPRCRPCRGCPGEKACASPVSQLLPARTTPELRDLQVTLGARLPYRRAGASAVLREFLPEGYGFNHVTTRNRPWPSAAPSMSNCVGTSPSTTRRQRGWIDSSSASMGLRQGEAHQRPPALRGLDGTHRRGGGTPRKGVRHRARPRRLCELPPRNGIAPRPGMPAFHREYLWQRWTEGVSKCQAADGGDSAARVSRLATPAWRSSSRAGAMMRPPVSA
jgi:hypothetical protein